VAYISRDRLEAAARARIIDGLSWAKSAHVAGVTESTLHRMRKREDADWIAAVATAREEAAARKEADET
jgi:hypothetical protein